MRRALALASVLVVAGCTASTPEIRYYRLDVSPPARDSARPVPRKPVLVVEELEVDAAYDDPRMVYRKEPVRLDRYHYHRWSAHPGRLLADALRTALDGTGAFRDVRRQRTGDESLILSGRVLRLEEVDESATRWEGALGLELRLREAATGDVLWSQTLQRTEALDERSPAGLARAISRALASMLEEVTPQLMRHSAGRPSTALR